TFERLAHLAVMGLGFVFLYSSDPGFGGLNARFLPPSPAIQIAAVALTALGLGLAALARAYLGRNWSAEVVIREDHRLIRSGPYARIRHPIYSGLLVALLAAVLEIGQWRAVVGFAIMSFAIFLKARREEQFLAEEFGEEFERYKQSTGLFIPRLRRKEH